MRFYYGETLEEAIIRSLTIVTISEHKKLGLQNLSLFRDFPIPTAYQSTLPYSMRIPGKKVWIFSFGFGETRYVTIKNLFITAFSNYIARDFCSCITEDYEFGFFNCYCLRELTKAFHISKSNLSKIQEEIKKIAYDKRSSIMDRAKKYLLKEEELQETKIKLISN